MLRPLSRLPSALLLATVLVGGPLSPVGSLAAVAPTPTRDISFTRWQGSGMSAGTNRGTVVTDAGVAFGTRTGTREYGGRSYERARWSGPWQTSAFSFTELVASWQATTRATAGSRSRSGAATPRACCRAGTCSAAGRAATSS